MLIKCSKTQLASIILILLLFAISPLPVWANQVDAANAISSAENTLLDCYNAAKDAETAGANITTIIGILNRAGELLSWAEFAYALKDFDVALNVSLQSQSILNNFVSEANMLEESATQLRTQDFLINVVGSAFGTFAVIIAGFAVWFFLKRKNEVRQI